MTLDLQAAGQDMYRQIKILYPLCRSITGEGTRQTLRMLQAYVPLEVQAIPTGTPVFDWTIPKEWNIRDAYVKNSRGKRVIDFKAHNLHVLNYSIPVHQHMTLEELRPYLHTLPDQPDLIPYRTSYYKETWGFCLRHRQLETLEAGTYEVCIDATLAPGHLHYGECLIPGKTPDEVLLSCHICHPSLCNDNLSGIAVATALAQTLRQNKPWFSYRFIFAPGTIGAIAWLAQNEAQTHKVKHGLVLANLGDGGPFTYKQTRQGNAEIDRAATHILQHLDAPTEIRPFSPYGYDERQYNSPGFNLPVGCLSRTPYGCFPEYHTSGDNLDFVSPAHLADSLSALWQIINVLEHNDTYQNLNPKGEPQLGKRGLYRATGGHPDAAQQQLAMLWVLNLTDGHHTLLDIADRSGLPFTVIREAATLLENHDLLNAKTGT